MSLDRYYRVDARPSLTGIVNELTGAENVKSALQNRLSTSYRSVPFLPNYGVQLKQYQNQPMTADLRSRIIQEVTEQIMRDPRVKSIRSVNVRTTTEGLFLISVDVVLIGTEGALNVEVRT